jgi:hypothetical protein
MFAALHCETIGFARVRFSIKCVSAFAQRSIAFRALARGLNRRKYTRRDPRRCIRVVASTQILTRPVVIAQADLDEDLITLLDRTARHPFQSHES